jgi:LCP family protein required for cell wall assembly
VKNRPYKVHAVKRSRLPKWAWAVIWSFVGLLVVLGGVAGGYYWWLDAKVSAANERVPQAVRDILANDQTTVASSFGASTTVSTVESPDSENILIMGSDTRSDTVDGSRSDTIILLHVDPTNNYMSMLSFPRDLRVEIDNYGTRKLNYAFAKGGSFLAIKTIQQITGLDIDHYLEVDFNAFVDMTNKLGGVYVEVDRPYHYLGYEYAKIDLDPGYQLLNGWNALSYVRYRHDLNADFGRMERQQRYLNSLRQQAMGWDLGIKLPGLVGAFFDNVTTDLELNDFIKLGWFGVKMDGARIRQVALRGMNQLSSGVTFVFWKPGDMAVAVQSLLTPPQSTSVASGGTTATSGGTTVSTLATTTTTIEKAPVIPTGADPGRIPNATIWRAVARKASFAVEAPSYVPKGYRIATRSKTYAYMYNVNAGGVGQPFVVMLYRNTGAGRAGQVKLQEEYINVTETSWLSAPAASPGRQVTYNGTVFTVVGTAGKVERIWWKKDSVLYWVSNTLARVTSEAELLAMAESMIPIPVR